MNKAINGTEVTFSWNANTGNSYEIKYSTIPDFSEYKTVMGSFSENTKPGLQLAFLPIFLLAFFFNFKRKTTLVIIMLLFSGFQCQKEDLEPNKSVLFSKTITGFTPGKEYYWKIKATPKYTHEFQSETIAYRFTVN